MQPTSTASPWSLPVSDILDIKPKKCWKTNPQSIRLGDLSLSTDEIGQKQDEEKATQPDQERIPPAPAFNFIFQEVVKASQNWELQPSDNKGVDGNED